jgi:hypothetical protein
MQESEETFQMAFLREKNNLSKETQEYLMGVEADINKELADLQNDLNILRDKKASENRINEVQAQYDSMLQYGQEMEAFARETEKGMYEEDGKYYSPTLGKTYTWNDRPSHEAALRDMQADWQAYLNRQSAGLRDSGKDDDAQNLFSRFMQSMYESGSLAGYVNEDGTINMEEALSVLGGEEGAHDFLDEYMDGDDTAVYTPENRALMHDFLDRFIETGEAPIEQGEIPDNPNLYPAEKEAMPKVIGLMSKLNEEAEGRPAAQQNSIRMVSEQLGELLDAFNTEGDYFERNDITVNEAIENLFNQTMGGMSPSASRILDTMDIDWRTLMPSNNEPVINTYTIENEEPENEEPKDEEPKNRRQDSDKNYVDQAFENEGGWGETTNRSVDLEKRNTAIIRKIDALLETATGEDAMQLEQWREMLQDPETDQMERIAIIESIKAMENE